MNGIFLRRWPRMTAIALMMAALLGCASVVCAADGNQDERWHFTLMPYLWAPSASGTLQYSLPPGWTGGNVDLTSGSYFGSLNFAGMLDLQAEKGKWSFLVDMIYVDVSDNDRKATFLSGLPGGGLTVAAETGLSAFVGEAVVGYAVHRTRGVDFNVIGGVRYADIEGKLTLNTTEPLPSGFQSATVSRRNNFIDPIVGFRGRFDLGKKWYLPYYFDIGGFGASADLTSQGFAGVGHQFCDLFSMVLGYRYLYYDFGDHFVKNLTLNGLAIGFGFQF